MNKTNNQHYPRIPLEYWSALVAVVDEGSFARAAETLHKSQSAISYAIAQLEAKLPTPAFSARGRKAQLTPAGEVMYRRAKQLLSLACDVELTAQQLADGWESKISIAVDAIVNIQPVLQAMQQFHQVAPQTRVTLLETTLSGTDEALLERRADLALTARVPPGFLATPIGEVRKIPVAHREHPLARAEAPLTDQDLRQARQIVIRDSGIKREQDQGWLGAEQRLTVSHFATALQALEAGLGFAFAPDHLATPALAQGTLVKLTLNNNSEQRIPLYLAHASQEHRGPATEAFAKLLQQYFSDVDRA